jgi:type I restriction enzyme R subunit
MKYENETIIVSRTGYTGEDGFELYGSHDFINRVWDILVDSKQMIEKEILYYNFLERELVVTGKGKKEYKHNDGRLISPRPKQKFGADKIADKIAEFIEHEKEPDYFIKKLEAELHAKGASEPKIDELVNKRLKYQNNKNVYSLLLQYAAGFERDIAWPLQQAERCLGDYACRLC